MPKKTAASTVGPSLKMLVAEYNEFVEEYGNLAEFGPVKSFKDKKTAEARIDKISDALDHRIAEEKKFKGEAAKQAKANGGKGCFAKKKPAAKKVPSQAEIDDLMGEAPGKRRGRKASFEYEAHPDGIADPREGTLRDTCLNQILKGSCTIDDLEETMRDYRDAKGATWKTSCRYRALEILKLLNRDNGYGFTEGDNGVIIATTA